LEGQNKLKKLVKAPQEHRLKKTTCAQALTAEHSKGPAWHFPAVACNTAGVQAIKGKALRQTAIAKPRIGSEHIQPKGKVFVVNFWHAVFE
jgi:hypothetical protein